VAHTNISAKIKDEGALTHLKAYAIDGKLLRTGSGNFSSSGLARQDNDLILTSDPATVQTPPETTADVVRQAFEEGYRAVDTAAAYRDEEGVGEALKGRNDVFLTTKLWNDDQGFDEMLRAFAASARKLRRDVVDLYLIHWPRPRTNRYVDSWKAMIRLRDDGKIRAIGVSNFSRDHLERVIGETGVTPPVNQIELHPRFQQRRLRAFHDAHGVRTESWSPLGRARFLGDPTVGGIAAKHGKTPAQVVIRWHLEQGLIVIPKTVHRNG